MPLPVLGFTSRLQGMSSSTDTMVPAVAIPFAFAPTFCLTIGQAKLKGLYDAAPFAQRSIELGGHATTGHCSSNLSTP